jgi:hypothetical protein
MLKLPFKNLLAWLLFLELIRVGCLPMTIGRLAGKFCVHSQLKLT